MRSARHSTGAVLPGVGVEAKSSALQGTKTAFTGPDGSYRVSLLPPGEYTVTFSIAGFGPTRKNAAVQLDKTVVVDATLALSTTAEVTVSGAAPVIDATSSTTGANFTSDFVKTLPIGRNRGETTFDGRTGFITVHPSSLLRIPDREARQSSYRDFVADMVRLGGQECPHSSIR